MQEGAGGVDSGGMRECRVRAWDSLVRSVSHMKNRSIGKSFQGEKGQKTPEIDDGEILCIKSMVGYFLALYFF